MGSGEPSLAQPDPATLARWREVAEAFSLPGRWLSSRPYGSGWINETLLVEREHGGRRTRWIQQRINARVFREPALVMENMARVTAHQRAVLEREGARDADRRALRLVTARDGRLAFVDADGEWWRTFHFIEGASSRDAVGSALEAGAAAEAFGRFLAQLADLPGARLHETIPHFHDARARFEQLVAAAKADVHGRLAECRRDFEFVLAREGMVARSETLRGAAARTRHPQRHQDQQRAARRRHQRGRLRDRPRHGDAGTLALRLRRSGATRGEPRRGG